MIKIASLDDKTIISAAVTDFADSLGYCEYKVPIIIQGIKAQPSQATIQGTIAHKEIEEYEKEHVELVPVTPKEITEPTKDVEFAREDIYTKLQVPLYLSQNNILVSLFGRTDKLKREEQTLVVQDDKFTSKPQSYQTRTEPYPSQLLQVLTYLNSIYSHTKSSDPDDWFSLPHKQKQWIVRIFDKKTRKPYKIFNQFQDSFHLQYLHNSIEQFARLALEIVEPTHHNIPAKCNACRYKNDCDFAL